MSRRLVVCSLLCLQLFSIFQDFKHPVVFNSKYHAASRHEAKQGRLLGFFSLSFLAKKSLMCLRGLRLVKRCSSQRKRLRGWITRPQTTPTILLAFAQGFMKFNLKIQVQSAKVRRICNGFFEPTVLQKNKRINSFFCLTVL